MLSAGLDSNLCPHCKLLLYMSKLPSRIVDLAASVLVLSRKEESNYWEGPWSQAPQWKRMSAMLSSLSLAFYIGSKLGPPLFAFLLKLIGSLSRCFQSPEPMGSWRSIRSLLSYSLPLAFSQVESFVMPQSRLNTPLQKRTQVLLEFTVEIQTACEN